jgi:hypothetical protein
MTGTLVDILVVILFAAFAIGSIIFIFALAGHVFNEILEAFQRSSLEGIGMLSLSVIALLAVVVGVHFALPYVVDFYHTVMG